MSEDTMNFYATLTTDDDVTITTDGDVTITLPINTEAEFLAEITRLRAELEELRLTYNATSEELEHALKRAEEAEDFKLSAGVCEHLVGDDGGHATCSFRTDNAMPKLLKMAEWCVGRCVTCALFGQECPKERFSSTQLWADHGPCPEWKPAWEL